MRRAGSPDGSYSSRTYGPQLRTKSSSSPYVVQTWLRIVIADPIPGAGLPVAGHSVLAGPHTAPGYGHSAPAPPDNAPARGAAACGLGHDVKKAFILLIRCIVRDLEAGL